MHKLCVSIVLIFVFKLALSDADENGFAHNNSDPNEKVFIPGTDKHSSTPTIEQKNLQRLDALEDSLKALVKENEKIFTMIALLKSEVNKAGTYPQNCREATKFARFSGIYTIHVEKYGSEPFEVFCEQELFDGGWTVVARRVDGTVNFENRNWTEYKQGFGNLNGNFFIGMDKLYALTNGQQSQELIFVMGESSYETEYAKYSTFAIGDENEEYKIKSLDGFSGNAGDSLSYHRNQTFKTKDRGNATSCSTAFGAWWYDDCYHSNLFGTYIRGAVIDNSRGIIWKHSRSWSLEFVQMMIRPKTA